MHLVETSTVLCSRIILGIDMQTWFVLIISFIVSSQWAFPAFYVFICLSIRISAVLSNGRSFRKDAALLTKK